MTDDPEGIPWIKIGDSTRESIYIEGTAQRIIAEGVARSRMVAVGDLLLSNSMSFGYPYITKVSGCIHDGWLVIRPVKSIEKLYLHMVFMSDYAKTAFSAAAAGAVVQNLNAEKVRLLAVPLPPLAEQHRIVAKVDELMAHCDRLEEARKTREETPDKLTAATLARLTAPEAKAASETDGTNAPSDAAPNQAEPGNTGTGSPSDTTTAQPSDFPTHARFAIETLPALTSRPDQINPSAKPS